MLADGVDAVLLLGLFVAAVYSIGDRVLNGVDQKPAAASNNGRRNIRTYPARPRVEEDGNEVHDFCRCDGHQVVTDIEALLKLDDRDLR